MLTCAQWAVVAPLMETDHSIVASFGALVQEDCLGCGTGLQTGSSSWLLLRGGSRLAGYLAWVCLLHLGLLAALLQRNLDVLGSGSLILAHCRISGTSFTEPGHKCSRLQLPKAADKHFHALSWLDWTAPKPG